MDMTGEKGYNIFCIFQTDCALILTQPRFSLFGSIAVSDTVLKMKSLPVLKQDGLA